MVANYLTQQDVADYGPELIDVTQRSALHAVAPHLQALENETAQLRQRLAIEARRNLDAAVERAIPNYRELDRDPEWRRWLSGVDALSGRVRQQLLNDAIASGDANRIIHFFRGFFGTAPATSQAASQPSGQARGRAASSGKPTYTREQIGRLYDQHRKGLLVGSTWDRLESDIFQAQHEGRVSGVYLTGK